MISELKSYWNYGNTYCAIEYTSIKGATKLFAITSIIKKNEFQDLSLLEATNFLELAAQLPRNQHAYLVVNSDQIITKETTPSKTQDETIAKAFPGLALEDFYYSILTTKDKSFVSLVRKVLVNELLIEANKNKINVLGIEVGFTSLNDLAPLIREEEIQINRYLLTTKDHQIISFQTNISEHSIEYGIENVTIPSAYLLTLSVLFRYVTTKVSSSNLLDTNKNLVKLYKEKNFFTKGMFLAVGIVLVAVIVNLFFFNKYNHAHQELKSIVLANTNKLNALELKTAEIDKKEKLTRSILNNQKSKSSYYINQINHRLPASILLTQLEFQPLLKSIRPNKQILYKKNELLISGDSFNKNDFSKWIQHLEVEPWVSNVTILAYGSENRKKDHFSISISL